MATADDVTFNAGVWTGSLLVLVGVIAYVLTDFASLTALIPSLFGLLFVVLGRLGLSTDRRRAVRYGLAAIALIGLAGSAQGVVDLATIATGGTVERPIAAVSQSVMVVVCVFLLALIGRSLAESR